MVEVSDSEKVARSNEIAAKVPKVKLNDGNYMPVIGLGTFLQSNPYDMVKKAILEDGYRHIDCAKIYQNEQDVGRAIKDCIAAGIKREDLYIVSKLWHDDNHRVAEALDECLERLGLDYLDLWIRHYPRVQIDDSPQKKITGPPNYLIWKEMEKLVKTGKVKSIGMSNCSVAMLYDTLAGCEIRPVYNQIESHPYFNRHNIRQVHADYGIVLCAYASIGSAAWGYQNPKVPKAGSVLQNPVITDIAAKHGRTAAQIIFAWHHHYGSVVLVQTSKPERLPENINYFDIKLTEEEIKAIDGLECGGRLFNPAYIDGFGWNNMPFFD